MWKANIRLYLITEHSPCRKQHKQQNRSIPSKCQPSLSTQTCLNTAPQEPSGGRARGQGSPPPSGRRAGACSPLHSQCLPDVKGAVHLSHCPRYIVGQPHPRLTSGALRGLHGLAFQLEWGEEKVLQSDTRPTPKDVPSEKP